MKQLQSNRILKLLIALTLILGGFWLVFSLFYMVQDDIYHVIRDSSIRFALVTVFSIILYQKGYPVFHLKKAHKKIALLLFIPALLISINNFPISAYLNDRVNFNGSIGILFVFVIESFSVGLFEEVLFRYIILVLILQQLKTTKYNLFVSVLLSAFIFGLIHIVNIFNGADALQILQQMGYSFLMGMLWAIVFIKTKNIWFPIVLHASYNYFGLVLFRFGNVQNRFDLITIIITVGLAVFAIAYYIYWFRTIQTSEIDKLKNGDSPT